MTAPQLIARARTWGRIHRRATAEGNTAMARLAYAMRLRYAAEAREASNRMTAHLHG